MISCHVAQSLLSRRLDESISPEDADRLARHLEQCEGCQHALAAFSASDGALRRALAMDHASVEALRRKLLRGYQRTTAAPIEASHWRLLGRAAAICIAATAIGATTFLIVPALRRVVVDGADRPDERAPSQRVNSTPDVREPPAVTEGVAEAILLLEERRGGLRYLTIPDRPRLPVAMRWSRVVLTDSPAPVGGAEPLEVFLELERVDAQLGRFSDGRWR